MAYSNLTSNDSIITQAAQYRTRGTCARENPSLYSLLRKLELLDLAFPRKSSATAYTHRYNRSMTNEYFLEKAKQYSHRSDCCESDAALYRWLQTRRLLDEAFPRSMDSPTRLGITPELLREIFHYDPETGLFLFKARSQKYFITSRRFNAWNDKFAGKPALTYKNSAGYLYGGFRDKLILASRAAFAISYGKLPDGDIDHINGITSDNRLSNIRDVSRTANTQNASISKRNTSGVTGVSFMSFRKLWKASIGVDGKLINLYHGTSKDDAIAARKAAEIKYGFHPNHGRAKPEV